MVDVCSLSGAFDDFRISICACETRMNYEAVMALDVRSEEPQRRRISAFVDRFTGPLASFVVLLYAIPVLVYPPGRDQGVYLELGRSLLQGKHLYSQLWDNKPPGIFIVYAGIVRIFGTVMWSVSLVQFVLLLTISYLLFRFAERYIGRVGAGFSAIVNALFLSGTRYFWIVQPEVLQMLCVLSVLLFLGSTGKRWKLRCLLAGLMCGFGFWQKYNFIAFLPVLLFLPFLDTSLLEGSRPRFGLMLSRREWLTRTALVLSGFVVTICAVFVWIVCSGAWPAMRESQFVVLPRYAAMAAQNNAHYLLISVVRIYRFLGPPNVVVSLVGLVVSWRTSDLKRFLPLFLVAVSALASVVLQARFHDYYFQVCFPFFAALWGYLALRFYETVLTVTAMLRERKQILLPVFIWILFVNICFWPIPDQIVNLSLRYVQLQEWRENAQRFYANYPDQLPFELIQGQLQVINYIRTHTTSNDTVYVWGSNSLIYFLAEKEPPTRFVHNLGVMAKWGQQSWKHEVVQGVESAKPKLIIVTRNDALPTITYVNMDSATYLSNSFPELRSYIDGNYKRAEEVKDFVIYTRN